MEELWLSRTQYLLEENIKKLKHAVVAIIGLGGVGGAAAEAVCRVGVGRLILMDPDQIETTNLNRQLLATSETIGTSKCEAAKKRFLSIVPNAHITALPIAYQASSHHALFSLHPDFIIDAMDDVPAKVDLAVQTKKLNIPSIMCLGSGDRLDPTSFRIGDLMDTKGSGCGLARVMRRKLSAYQIIHHPVVYSIEAPKKHAVLKNQKYQPGSISFCPPVAGYFLAAFAVHTLLDSPLYLG